MPEGDNVLRRSYLPEDLAPHLERTGISKTVVVQAQMTMAEADLLFDLAASAESIAGVVAWVDLTDPNVGATLDRLQKIQSSSASGTKCTTSPTSGGSCGTM